MEIEKCIEAFSQIKSNFFTHLATISKSKQKTVLCNDTNFLVINLEKIQSEITKIGCCVADGLWFDKELGLVIIEFKSGEINDNEKHRLKLQLYESILFVIPEIISNRLKINVTFRDTWDLNKCFIIVYNSEKHILYSKNFSVHAHIKKKSQLNSDKKSLTLNTDYILKSKLFDKIFVWSEHEFQQRLDVFRKRKLFPN